MVGLGEKEDRDIIQVNTESSGLPEEEAPPAYLTGMIRGGVLVNFGYITNQPKVNTFK